MGYLYTAGSHPARKLGLCAARGGPERHRRSPSCARRAGTGRVSGLVGRVGALKSCPNAGGRADMPDMPNQPGGLCAWSALWRAGGRAQQGARWPPALSQRSPRTFHLHPDPGRPLLNLPLRLRCWHPSKSKIMMITTAQRGERGQGPGEGEVEGDLAEKHDQGVVVSPPSSRTRWPQRRQVQPPPQMNICSALSR